LEHEFYFPFHIWDVILPIDELHHFSRWAHCTTNQFIFTHDMHHYNIIIFTIKLTIISTSLYLLYSPLN
jgi:hypothetical protein